MLCMIWKHPQDKVFQRRAVYGVGFSSSIRHTQVRFYMRCLQVRRESRLFRVKIHVRLSGCHIDIYCIWEALGYWDINWGSWVCPMSCWVSFIPYGTDLADVRKTEKSRASLWWQLEMRWGALRQFQVALGISSGQLNQALSVLRVA